MAEAIVYPKTRTKARTKSGTIFAFGRSSFLDGKPKNLGGYAVFKLRANYNGKVRGGIERTWIIVKENLDYKDAIALMNRRLGFMAFDLWDKAR